MEKFVCKCGFFLGDTQEEADAKLVVHQLRCPEHQKQRSSLEQLLHHTIDGQKLIMKGLRFLLHRNGLGGQLIKDMNEWAEKEWPSSGSGS